MFPLWVNFSSNCMRRILNNGLILILLLTGSGLYGSWKGSMRIQGDTIPLGRPFEVQVVVSYPKDATLLAPDTSQAFKPYEFISLTRSSGGSGISISDTLLYRIRSFETYPRQILSLDFRLSQNGDSQTFTLTDSFQLASRLPAKLNPGDSLTTQYHLDLLPIHLPPDYSGILLMALVVVVILGLTAYFLYTPVRRWWARRKLHQAYSIVQHNVQRLDPSDAETFLYHLNRLVREYLSAGSPYHLDSLSTSELKSLHPGAFLSSEDHQFLIHLGTLTDQVVYAGQAGNPPLVELRQTALNCMKTRLNQLIREVQV